jgi:hypothetical protein
MMFITAHREADGQYMSMSMDVYGIPEVGDALALLSLETDLEKEMLESAPDLVRLAEVPVGATIHLDMGSKGGEDRTELSFRLMAAPEGVHPNTVEWAQLGPDGQLYGPMALYGACALRGVLGARGVIKQGLGLSYAYIAAFRSGADAPQELGIAPDLPFPERLDPSILQMNMSIGQVAMCRDNLLRWRMPQIVYELGPIFNAQVI